MPKFSIIGEFETRLDKHDEFERLIKNHANICLAQEPGTIRFELHHPVDDFGEIIPNRLLVNEMFADKAAIDFHRTTARMQEVAAQFDLLLSKFRFITSEIAD